MGLAEVIADKRVDFPALGKPTSPTSANTLSSNRISFSSPGIPGCAYRGVWLVADLKCQFPKPPFPPFRTITSSLSKVISKSTSLVITSLTIVPRGTSR